MARKTRSPGGPAALEKAPTGITGLDDITFGGLPKGRPTLICGSAGCGKSLMGIEFLVRGARDYDEPGVLMSFEEPIGDITKNVASLGFDLDQMIDRNQLCIDHVRIERSEIEENGEYDLEGIFIRLDHAIRTVGARRVMLDTIEALFSGLSNQAILRAELRRLFGWLKDRGMTTVITAERGEGQLTRQGLEEYVSDCVILLDHRVTGQISTRRLRVVKYRGSIHGTNEYPFIIDEEGISVLPITSVGLNHAVSTQRVSSGVERLDTMLGGKGLYRGSSVLVTGTAGTGKSSLAAHFAAATCARGERAMYFAFEESRDQIIRNMRSIGVDLGPCVDQGLLEFHNARPSVHGLESHLALMHKRIGQFKPASVIIDPITNLISVGNPDEAHAMLVRLVDFLKVHGITAMFTSLTSGDDALEGTELGVSSIMDTWILLRDIEIGGERNRGLYVLKSRGMAHSNQIREFRLTPRGIELLDVYTGPEGVLTGSARLAQEAREQAEQVRREQEVESRRRELERQRAAMEAQIAVLQADFEAREQELRRTIAEDEARDRILSQNRRAMARSRKSDAATDGNGTARTAGRNR